MLDADLAKGVRRLDEGPYQAVRRNAVRFPPDFRFQLDPVERDEVVTTCDRLTTLRFSPNLPWAFTEHGAIMAASVLNSPRAVEMSVFVVRAFVRLRALTGRYREVASRLDAIERKVVGHDKQIQAMFAAIRGLLSPVLPSHRRPIGFRPRERG